MVCCWEGAKAGKKMPKVGLESPTLEVFACGAAARKQGILSQFRTCRAWQLNRLSRSARDICFYLNRLKRRLLVITKMLLKDIAPAASMGLRKPAAAAGMRMTL